MSGRPRLLLSPALPRRRRAILLRLRKETKARSAIEKTGESGNRKVRWRGIRVPDCGGRVNVSNPTSGIQTHLQRVNLREGTFERLQRFQVRGCLLHDELWDIHSLLVDGTWGGGGNARVSLRLMKEKEDGGAKRKQRIQRRLHLLLRVLMWFWSAAE